jgi:hypothetical protein
MGGGANKTTPNSGPVGEFLAGVDDPKRRADATALCALLAKATGAEPTMWGSAIVGFGNHHYVYESGREGDTAAVGFSPRKAALTIYGMLSSAQDEAEVDALGPLTTGKGCIYIKDLDAIDQKSLTALAKRAYAARND